ncbi:uncharactized protein [Erwinia sp. Ejp617]|nr:hypothetical protein [Erwinia sp. Ejp617]ADP12201.1 uncharactized protein [Erwinia sp. Ejp617]
MSPPGLLRICREPWGKGRSQKGLIPFHKEYVIPPGVQDDRSQHDMTPTCDVNAAVLQNPLDNPGWGEEAAAKNQ